MAVPDLGVAFVVPRSGPSGILAPTCEACATLAVEEINAAGGVLGRELALRMIDGAGEPGDVAAHVDRLVGAGLAAAVVGWHGSATLRTIVATIRRRVPYIYAAPHEGRARGPGVFFTGETPSTQVVPALRWLARERRVRRWYIVGSDDEWPLMSAQAARTFAMASGADVCGEEVLPVGTELFGPTVRRVERSGAQGVLMLLVGMDAVRFNRTFTQMLTDGLCVRFAPLMEENMLLASGAANTTDLYAAARYFETLPTSEALHFGRRYNQRFGVDAPTLNSPGESCYEALTLLAGLAEQAGSLRSGDLTEAARSGMVTCIGPRGVVGLRRDQLEHHTYLARAAGVEFDVIANLTDDA